MKNGGKTFNASDVANADWNILPGLTRRRTRAQRARGPIGGGGGLEGSHVSEIFAGDYAEDPADQ